MKPDRVPQISVRRARGVATRDGLERLRLSWQPRVRSRSRCSGGVTLVELMVVMAIVALIAAIGVPLYTNHVAKVWIATAVADIRRLEVHIQRFLSDTGRLPDALSELGTNIPLDPWGTPYRYLNLQALAPADKGKRRKDKNLVPINSDFDLFSSGPDGESRGPLTAKASRDDIVRASNGGFVGPAADH